MSYLLLSYHGCNFVCQDFPPGSCSSFKKKLLFVKTIPSITSKILKLSVFIQLSSQVHEYQHLKTRASLSRELLLSCTKVHDLKHRSILIEQLYKCQLRVFHPQCLLLFLLLSNIPCFAICCVKDSVKVKRHLILYPEVIFMNGQGEARIDFS